MLDYQTALIGVAVGFVIAGVGFFLFFASIALSFTAKPLDDSNDARNNRLSVIGFGILFVGIMVMGIFSLLGGGDFLQKLLNAIGGNN